MSRHTTQMILQDKPISYHPDIARVCGGVKAGVFFSQLMYWSDKGKRADGYIWKTQDEWEAETALTRYEQESARKTLKGKGFLSEKLQGVPARLHYAINWDAFLTALEDHYMQQTSLGKSHILDWGKPPNKDAGFPQTIPESTTENTKEDGVGAYKRVIAIYENEISPSLTPIISADIQTAIDEFGESVVIEAIGIAAKNSARTWRYVEGVLNRWRVNGRRESSSNGASTKWTPA